MIAAWKVPPAPEPEYIDREAAIKAVEIVDFYKDADMIPTGYASDAIKAIPAADVREVKRGHNTMSIPSFFECSACGWGCADTFWGDTPTYNYCPNCGARMEES